MDEYRCSRCNHLLFRGSLRLLVAKRTGADTNVIETKCRKCGRINTFTYDPEQEVHK